MIKINLLPQELRKWKKNETNIPHVPLAILAGVLFLLLTLFFYGDYLKARSAHKIVQVEWERLIPLMAQLKALEKKVEIEMKGEKDFLQANVLNTESMTRILLWTSEFLPPKGWLTEFTAEREGAGCRLVLKGIVLPSRTQTAIDQIEEYFQKMKTKLPPQTVFTLTTSREKSEKIDGTAFIANLEWGVTKKS